MGIYFWKNPIYTDNLLVIIIFVGRYRIENCADELKFDRNIMANIIQPHFIYLPHKITRLQAAGYRPIGRTYQSNGNFCIIFQVTVVILLYPLSRIII